MLAEGESMQETPNGLLFLTCEIIENKRYVMELGFHLSIFGNNHQRYLSFIICHPSSVTDQISLVLSCALSVISPYHVMDSHPVIYCSSSVICFFIVHHQLSIVCHMMSIICHPLSIIAICLTFSVIQYPLSIIFHPLSIINCASELL